MSSNQILADTVDKFFAEVVTPDLLRRVEAGEWPEALWKQIVDLGLTQIFDGASDDPWRDAAIVIKACGRYALPLPLPEALIANASDASRPASRTKRALSREPWAPKLENIPQPNLALMRAAQMAGAVQRILELSVLYARDRVQFGKPIGSFQAIQQQLAVLAGQAAAANAAVDAAFETAARGGDIAFDAAVAKVRAGEAAGLAAAIGHQVHGAIGFTDEHILHYFTRRLWTWRAEFGSETYWSRWLGQWAVARSADGLWPALATPR